MTPARVRKRDGAEESFEELRLVESLEGALESGSDRSEYARQFAETVMVRLARRGEDPVDTETIAATAAEVLRGFGCAPAAEAFLAYRADEQELVQDLRVHGQGGREDGCAPWDRARLARSLVRDRYFEGLAARRIARRVERRAVAIGLRHLTGRVVSALADNECRSLGLASGPPTPERLGLDRRHLRAWLGGACLPLGIGGGALPALGPDAQDPRPALGEELLARFALEEILTHPQREAWEAGRFEIPGLGDWLRPACLRLRPAEEEDEEAFWHRVAAQASRTRELQVFVPARVQAGALARNAPLWLRSGPARLRLATSDPLLALDWSRAGLWHAMPVAAFLELGATAREELAAREHTLVQWAPPQPRLPPAAERLCSAVDRVAVINLAAAARQAGAWEELGFHQAVAESLDQATQAIRGLAERAQSGAHPRAAILPAGLETAASMLYPDAAVRAGRMRRFLLDLRDLFDRLPRRAGLRPEPFSPPHPEAAGARLAERAELAGTDALPLGWCWGLESVEMVGLVLDTAPWLELPAARLHASPWASRFLTSPAPTAREVV
jgi:hypothetical protein